MRLTGWYVEKQGVKAIPFLDDASPLAIGFSGLFFRAEMIFLIQVMRGEFLDTINALDQVLPKTIDVIRLGEFPGHADDGYFRGL